MIAGRLEIYPLFSSSCQKLGQKLKHRKLLWIHLSKGVLIRFRLK